MKKNVGIIILAGGKSVRFGSKIKKQFINLDGKSVLEHSIETFSNLSIVKQIIIVLPKQYLFKKEYVKLRKKYLNKNIVFAVAGEERYNSVQNGLKFLKDNIKIVGIHDAARPLVSKKIVLNCVEVLRKYDGVVPGINVSDTLKLVNDKFEIARHIDRENIYAVQTPQMFKVEVVKKIYSQKVLSYWTKLYKITDDSQLAQLEGFKIKVICGEKRNLKITSKDDLELIKFYLGQKILL